MATGLWSPGLALDSCFIFLWCLPWLFLVKMPASFQKGLWGSWGVGLKLTPL